MKCFERENEKFVENQGRVWSSTDYELIYRQLRYLNTQRYKAGILAFSVIYDPRSFKLS